LIDHKLGLEADVEETQKKEQRVEETRRRKQVTTIACRNHRNDD